MYKYLGLVFIIGMLFISCSKDNEEENPCNEPFEFDLGDDIIIQEGTSTVLDAGISGMSYLWSTGEKTQTIIVSETDQYWVEVSSCSHYKTDSILVEVSYPTIKVETDFGDFRIWLYHETPLHRENYLELTNDGFYSGLNFHRVVENFVIQGGDPDGTGFGGPGYTIPAEIIPELSHAYGAVGAARLGNDVNPEKESNGSQFYVVSDPNGEAGLDGEYTVFGIVFEGLEVVYDISQVAVNGNYKPFEDVIMNSVSVDYLTAKVLADTFGFDVK